MLEIDAAAVAAEAANARRMRRAYVAGGFVFPDDLEVGSLRREFPYNTDLLALHSTAEPELSEIAAASPGTLAGRGGAEWASGPPRRRPQGFSFRDQPPPPNHVSCWWREGCFFREGHGLLGPRSRVARAPNATAPMHAPDARK